MERERERERERESGEREGLLGYIRDSSAGGRQAGRLKEGRQAWRTLERARSPVVEKSVQVAWLEEGRLRRREEAEA